MTPTFPSPPSSQQVRQLSRILTDTLREYRQQHPAIKDREVLEALRASAMETGIHNERQARVMLVALAVAGLVFLGAVVLYTTL